MSIAGQATSGSETSLPRAVRAFLCVTVSLTALCGGVEIFCSRWLGWDYPYTWPLMPFEHPFMDFGLYEERFKLFHSAAFFSFIGPGYFYPAPMTAVHKLFFLAPHPTEVYLALMAATFLAALCWLGRTLVARGMARRPTVLLLTTLAACSYPFFFEFEQANLEWVIWVVVAAGIYAYLRGRGYAAAACFGLAGSMKIYPLILTGLLISRRQYRQAAAAFGVCAVSVVVSLWLVCPDLAVAWHGTQAGLAGFRQWYILHYEEVGFDHSLIALFKAASLVLLHRQLTMQGLALVVGIYLPVFAFAGVLLYFDKIRKLPAINQVICLVVATILLPPVSYDYTLIHLYVPWVLLVLLAIERRGEQVRGLTAAMVCLAVTMAPETELIELGRSYGGQVKAVALVALFGVALRYRFESEWDKPNPALRAG